MTLYVREIPIGVRFLQILNDKCCPRLRINREWCYRASILFLTYLAYMCYHLSRKPISVVKAVLHQNCSRLAPPGGGVPLYNNATWCDWAPFDGSDSDASTLLGTLDSAFLFAYAIAMFMSGFVAERVNLRYFLALGMLLSGLASYLFGIAKSYNIHNLSYFICVMVFGGIVQTTGWPGVVTTVGKWFGKGKRGLIFGIWNSHTSIGNILGSLIAAKYVETNWANSFIVPGLVIGVCGFILFLFLVVSPVDVGLPAPNTKTTTIPKKNGRHLDNRVANIDSDNDSVRDDTEILIGEQDELIRFRVTDDGDDEYQRRPSERTYLLSTNQQPGSSSSSSIAGSEHEQSAIGFLGACKIPGVIEFSLSLFFSKLVSYTFLYWLPLYLANSTTMGAELSADLSTCFDIGGIFGAILAGIISDYSGMSAFTCVIMLMLAAPMMFVYQHFCTLSIEINIILLIIVGVLVNGPYALITTAVSAELGTHSSLEDNSKALATVTAIIDGTGSIGAAVGPLLAGFVSSHGWHNVFYMLIISDIFALVLLLRLLRLEINKYTQQRRQLRNE